MVPKRRPLQETNRLLILWTENRFGSTDWVSDNKWITRFTFGFTDDLLALYFYNDFTCWLISVTKNILMPKFVTKNFVATNFAYVTKIDR